MYAAEATPTAARATPSAIVCGGPSWGSRWMASRGNVLAMTDNTAFAKIKQEDELVSDVFGS
jgi:hypothetical protein